MRTSPTIQMSSLVQYEYKNVSNVHNNIIRENTTFIIVCLVLQSCEAIKQKSIFINFRFNKFENRCISFNQLERPHALLVL